MDCTAFLQWALPRLGMRWLGFRKVRGQVCKRVRRRLKNLGLDGFAAYRAYLETHDDEWRRLRPTLVSVLHIASDQVDLASRPIANLSGIQLRKPDGKNET